jgi:hypothetical protein
MQLKLHSTSLSETEERTFFLTSPLIGLVERAANKERGIGVVPPPDFNRPEAEMHQAPRQCECGIPTLDMHVGGRDRRYHRQHKARRLPGQGQCSQGIKAVGV